MNRHHSSFFTHFRLGMLSVLVFSSLALFLPVRCLADGLDVSVTNPSQTASAGQTVVFSGTVTNDTGSDLTATDFFFDFFGYDPELDPNQLLGLTDFSIPDGTTTSIVELFSVTLGSPMGSGSFPVYFVLLDAYADESAVDKVTVVSGNAVPEPSTILLIAIGLLILSMLPRIVAKT